MKRLAFHPDRQTPPRNGPYALDGVEFRPGWNELSDADWQRASKHGDYDPLKDAGVIEEGWGKEPTSKPKQVTAAPAALTLINNASQASEITPLPGIGTVSAGVILTARPTDGYASLEEVALVEGLSNAIDWDAVEAWEA